MHDDAYYLLAETVHDDSGEVGSKGYPVLIHARQAVELVAAAEGHLLGAVLFGLEAEIAHDLDDPIAVGLKTAREAGVLLHISHRRIEGTGGYEDKEDLPPGIVLEHRMYIPVADLEKYERGEDDREYDSEVDEVLDTSYYIFFHTVLLMYATNLRKSAQIAIFADYN